MPLAIPAEQDYCKKKRNSGHGKFRHQPSGTISARIHPAAVCQRDDHRPPSCASDARPHLYGDCADPLRPGAAPGRKKRGGDSRGRPSAHSSGALPRIRQCRFAGVDQSHLRPGQTPAPGSGRQSDAALSSVSDSSSRALSGGGCPPAVATLPPRGEKRHRQNAETAPRTRLQPSRSELLRSGALHGDPYGTLPEQKCRDTARPGAISHR